MKKAARKKTVKARVKKSKLSLLVVVIGIIAVLGAVVYFVISQNPSKKTEAGFANSTSMVPPSPYNTCDFNKDGMVDKGDVDLIGANFQLDRTKVNKIYDVNHDGVVNSLDLQIVANNNPTYCVISYPSPMTTYNTCDFNKDGAIDQKDVDLVGANFEPNRQKITQEQLMYDINHDGAVNSLDLQIVASKNSRYCFMPAVIQQPNGSPTTVSYNKCDFNLDGTVNSGDQAMQSAHLGKVTDNTKQYDVNGDGYVNAGDQGIVANYIATKTSKYCIAQ